MKMINILFLLTFFSCHSENRELTSTIGNLYQEKLKKIELQISSRVDTSKTEVTEVLRLYENYLNSRPDSIYNNPYWNEKEKTQYKDFDFSREAIYNGLNSEQLFTIYKPFVLSIEPKNFKYQIRVMYSNNATEPPYVGSKIWCIHKLNAIKEEGKWKLENLAVEKTEKWNNTQIGFIEYLYSNEHEFNEKQAEKSLRFCKKIIAKYNPTFNRFFKFYLANDVDEMGELENFDYYFVGITTGKSREKMVVSSLGSEFYPHEFIHQLLPKNESRGYVIEEGLATFLGTKENLDEYLSRMRKLANDFNKKESYSLQNILNNQTKWNGYQTAYPGGALICEVIYEQKGEVGINELAQGKTKGYDEIISLTKNIIKMTETEVLQLIEQKLKEFE